MYLKILAHELFVLLVDSKDLAFGLIRHTCKDVKANENFFK